MKIPFPQTWVVLAALLLVANAWALLRASGAAQEARRQADAHEEKEREEARQRAEQLRRAGQQARAVLEGKVKPLPTEDDKREEEERRRFAQQQEQEEKQRQTELERRRDQEKAERDSAIAAERAIMLRAWDDLDVKALKQESMNGIKRAIDSGLSRLRMGKDYEALPKGTQAVAAQRVEAAANQAWDADRVAATVGEVADAGRRRLQELTIPDGEPIIGYLARCRTEESKDARVALAERLKKAEEAALEAAQKAGEEEGRWQIGKTIVLVAETDLLGKPDVALQKELEKAIASKKFSRDAIWVVNAAGERPWAPGTPLKVAERDALRTRRYADAFDKLFSAKNRVINRAGVKDKVVCLIVWKSDHNPNDDRSDQSIDVPDPKSGLIRLIWTGSDKGGAVSNKFNTWFEAEIKKVATSAVGSRLIEEAGKTP